MAVTSVDQAVKMFLKKHPDCDVIYCMDYDDDYYVLLPFHMKGGNNAYDLHYAVRKKDGDIATFNVMGDYKKFVDARDHRCKKYM